MIFLRHVFSGGFGVGWRWRVFCSGNGLLPFCHEDGTGGEWSGRQVQQKRLLRPWGDHDWWAGEVALEVLEVFESYVGLWSPLEGA